MLQQPDCPTVLHLKACAEVVKVYMEFRATSQNLLSSRYILCTTDLSSNVKKELQKVLA